MSDSTNKYSFKNKLGEYALFSSFAYKSEPDDIKELAMKLPTGYKMFLHSSELDETKAFNYSAVVFVNTDKKEILIANTGTRLKNLSHLAADLKSDFSLYLEQAPDKAESVYALNQMIIDNLEGNLGEYKFSYTGHSLGAALAEIGAADMAIKLTQKGYDLKDENGKNIISSTAFESPGTRRIIEKLYKEQLPDANINEDVDYTIYNNGENIINMNSPQVGVKHDLSKVVNLENKDPLENIYFKFLSNWFGDYFKFFNEVLEIIADLLGMNRNKNLTIFENISNHMVMEQLTEHVKNNSEIQNINIINEILLKPDAQSSNNITRSYIDYNSDLYNYISEIKKSNESITGNADHGDQNIVMYSSSGEELLKFSKDELNKAINDLVKISSIEYVVDQVISSSYPDRRCEIYGKLLTGCTAIVYDETFYNKLEQLKSDRFINNENPNIGDQCYVMSKFDGGEISPITFSEIELKKVQRTIRNIQSSELANSSQGRTTSANDINARGEKWYLTLESLSSPSRVR